MSGKSIRRKTQGEHQCGKSVSRACKNEPGQLQLARPPSSSPPHQDCPQLSFPHRLFEDMTCTLLHTYLLTRSERSNPKPGHIWPRDAFSPHILVSHFDLISYLPSLVYTVFIQHMLEKAFFKIGVAYSN